VEIVGAGELFARWLLRSNTKIAVVALHKAAEEDMLSRVPKRSPPTNVVRRIMRDLLQQLDFEGGQGGTKKAGKEKGLKKCSAFGVREHSRGTCALDPSPPPDPTFDSMKRYGTI